MRLAQPIDTSLPDGAPIRIRSVTPADAALIEQGFAGLSERSRFLRFLRPMRVLDAATLAAAVDVDGDRRVAIGALDLATEPPTPCALARYVRDTTRADEAEIAVTVVDIHQGRGLGCVLVGVLATMAAEAGLAAFTALVHAENVGMRAIFEELGGEVTRREGLEVEMRIPLHRDAARYPSDAYAATVTRSLAPAVRAALGQPS